MELTKGANTALPDGALTVTVRWSGLGQGIDDVDVSAFLLTDSGRVRGDEDMVFYGQRESADGAVKISALSQDGKTVLAVEPAKLAGGLEKVAITATLTSSKSPAFSAVGAVSLDVDGPGGSVATFAVDTAGANEAALILGELYKRNGAWKFRAVGQGFNGGLQPLAEHYGVDIAAPEPKSEPTPAPAAVPPPAPAASSTPPAAATSAAPSISLSKISLSKSSPTISLEKKGGTLGEIKINLDWHQGEPKKGLFGMKSGGIDLDLCCLFELADGTRFGIQALGKNFGEFDASPWIQLAGDDRTGSVSGGEWMRINGEHWGKIKRVMIYAMIYEGVPNWSATDGVVMLYVPGNPEVEVRLEGTSGERLCAVTLLENDGGNLKITRENRYFKSAQDMDAHYGFQLSWAKGRK